jgi:hypothetical protein
VISVAEDSNFHPCTSTLLSVRVSQKKLIKYKNLTCNEQVLGLMIYNQNENAVENPTMV